VKTVALIFSAVFLFASVAWEGPACASLKGRPTCCRQCPFKMLPKVGNSCCSQGVEKGVFVKVIPPSSKKPIAAIAMLSLEKDDFISHRLGLVLKPAFPSKVPRVYLFEEHLLL